MVIRHAAALATAFWLALPAATPLNAQSLAALASPQTPAPPRGAAPSGGQPAAPVPVSVEVLPAFRAGDEFRLQVTHTQEHTATPQRNATVVTPIQVRVRSTGPKGSVLEWTPGTGKTNNAQMAADPVMQAAGQAVGNLSFELSLSADAELEGVLNETEVVSKLQSVLRIFTDALMAKVPAEQQASVRNTLNQVLSPETLLLTALRDPQTYFGLNGAVLDVGDEVEVDIEQPGPFGPDPIPAVLWVKAESATPETFVIVTKTTYDGEAIAKMTASVLEKAGAPLTAAEKAMPLVEMRDEGRYVYDRALGLAREVVVSRVTAAGPERRTDRFEITMVQPPRR